MKTTTVFPTNPINTGLTEHSPGSGENHDQGLSGSLLVLSETFVGSHLGEIKLN